MPTLPPTFTGNNTGAGIVLDSSGKFVFVTNRGHESVGTFSIDQVSGMLSPLHWVGSEGRKPRFFTTDPSGDFLYVANQDSDSIVVFRNHHGSGEVVPTGQVIETGTPTCIVFSRL